MEQKTIQITGMSCGHCVGAVRNALDGIDGVRVVDVKVGAATVEYDPQRVDEKQLATAVEGQGFGVASQGS